MAVYKRGEVWWLDFRHGGERVRRYGGRTKKEAMEALDAVLTDLRRGQFGFLRKVRSPAFNAFADEYLATPAVKSKRSRRRDRLIMKHAKAFFGSKPLSEIHPFDIERYKAWREGQNTAHGHAPTHSTVDRELCTVRRMFNLAIEWGRTRANPVSGRQFYKENRERQYVLDQDEEQKLLAAAAPHIVPMIKLALGTAMRKSEILNLRWGQIDFQRCVIRLGAEDSKNKKPDAVALNREMMEMIKGLPREGPYVFGGAAPFQDIKTAWRTALEKAGLPEVIRFHDMRHTAATRLVSRGADPATVMAILRHSSLKMVMRYVHPSEKAKREAVELLSNDGHNVVTFPQEAPQEAACALA